MNVYFRVPHGMSRAMSRVENALRRHLPSGVNEVTRREDADLEVLHVIGVPGVEDYLASMTAKQYAVIQYCVKTTDWNESQWLDKLWKDASVVWSYYDLRWPLRMGPSCNAFEFYHAPLGVESSFRRWVDKERFLVGCTGYVAEPECLHEVARAAGRTDWFQRIKVFHLGPDSVGGEGLNNGPMVEFPHVKSFLNISDDVLAQMYSRCRYVAGLRRTEGFEMPMAEALLCGALPITFDQPHYRKWYDGLALFIKEGSPQEVEDQLVDIFNEPAGERLLLMGGSALQGETRNRFNWHNIAPNFWHRALSSPRPIEARTLINTADQAMPVVEPTRLEPMLSTGRRPKVLWVGDACVSSGFAVATHKTCDELVKRFDVRVLGLHCTGDPHPYAYPIYTTWFLGGGDVFGTKKLPQIIDDWKPDYVIIQQDPWNFSAHTQQLVDKWAEDPTAHRPILIGAVAVDGLNCRGRGLRHLDHAVFWTEFGRVEAIKGGWEGPSSVIPLGVDHGTYYPVPTQQARRFLKLDPKYDNTFIVGYVGRNQPRKRLDLLFRYFAEWVKQDSPTDVMLFIHYAPTGEDAYDLAQLGDYYGINSRVFSARPALGYGASPKHMLHTYNSFNVLASTTQGEGMGLPHLESMRCGVVNLYPKWSALEEVIGPAGYAVPCSSVAHTPNRINVIGGIADEQEFVKGLRRLYMQTEMRGELSKMSIARASEPQFNWTNIGLAWADLLTKVERRNVQVDNTETALA